MSCSPTTPWFRDRGRRRRVRNTAEVKFAAIASAVLRPGILTSRIRLTARDATSFVELSPRNPREVTLLVRRKHRHEARAFVRRCRSAWPTPSSTGPARRPRARPPRARTEARPACDSASSPIRTACCVPRCSTSSGKWTTSFTRVTSAPSRCSPSSRRSRRSPRSTATRMTGMSGRRCPRWRGCSWMGSRSW